MIHIVPVGLSIVDDAREQPQAPGFRTSVDTVLEHPQLAGASAVTDLPAITDLPEDWPLSNPPNAECAELYTLLADEAGSAMDTASGTVLLLASDDQNRKGIKAALALAVALVRRLNALSPAPANPWTLHCGLPPAPTSLDRAVVLEWIPGLDAQSPATFGDAAGLICKAIGDTHRRAVAQQAQGVQWRLHLSGGFKVLGQFMPTLAGLVARVCQVGNSPEVFTAFEGARSIRVPLPPGNLDDLAPWLVRDNGYPTWLRDLFEQAPAVKEQLRRLVP